MFQAVKTIINKIKQHNLFTGQSPQTPTLWRCFIPALPPGHTPNRHRRSAAGEERAFLFVRKIPVSGSLTIEAALVLPIFLMFIAAVMYFLIIISLQSDIQLRIEETARDLGKKAYLTDDSEILETINTNPLVIKAEILDDDLTERIENSGIKNSTSGVSTILSAYDEGTGILDIVVTYQYVIPYLPENISTISFLQRCRSRVWIGSELSESTSAGESSDGQTVYITPTGSAYHLTKSCPYLDLSIHSTLYATIESERNLSGSKYERCTACTDAGASYVTVYITDYGTNWHASLSCSGLKRTVIAVDISEVGSRHLCSKCGGS